MYVLNIGLKTLDAEIRSLQSRFGCKKFGSAKCLLQLSGLAKN